MSNPSWFLWNSTHLVTWLPVIWTASRLKDGSVSSWLELVKHPTDTEKNFVGINPQKPHGMCHRLPTAVSSPWSELALSKVPVEGAALSCVTTEGGQTLCQAAQLDANSSIM